MKVMVVGSGAREHMLVWKIAQSPRVDKIYCAPGNPNISDLAEIVDIKAANIVELADFAAKEEISLTVVGPEQPLALGIVDEFSSRNLHIFGPRQNAAVIESSKAFAKEFMRKHNIPTAQFAVFNTAEEATKYSLKARYPLVIKADGLAAGKGVFICQDKKDAADAIQTIMVDHKFGQSGDSIVVEEFLEGSELSFMVISDGKRVVPLVTSMDYKKIFENDQGPNSGGMGAISPAPQIQKNLFTTIMKRIINPTIEGMREDNREYRGVLYAGLMITANGPSVLEYNVRFGDPETQAFLLRLNSDLLELLEGSVLGSLYDIEVNWDNDVAGCVVLASEGYPGNYQKGKPINGLERARAQGVHLFHAGTTLENNQVITSGGRVLSVCAKAATLKETMETIYTGIKHIEFDGMQYRRDIGKMRSENG